MTFAAQLLLLHDVREHLRHVKDAVIGLKSAGESFVRSREDSIDVHFFTLQSAEAALKHYEAN